MIINNDDKNRLVIFFFYDKEGIVDDYIPYMLRDIRKSVKDFFIVCNGKLSTEGHHKFEEFTDEILVRKNKGFDVYAYRKAIKTIGWDRLRTYDEVIFMNYTIMGPIHPFAEMFEVMSKRDLDFWGITKFHKVPADPWGVMKCGYIREHIQSHFICVRNKMLCDPVLENYWKKMPMIRSYQESVAFHESRFTHYFHKRGYDWEVYVDTSDLDSYTKNPIIYCATELIRDRKSPIIKRRSFMHEYDDMLNCSVGEASYELMEYLKTNTDYDTNMIWDNLLRCYDMKLIKNVLHLNYVLSSTLSKGVSDIVKKRRIALVGHIYYEDQIDYCYRYILNMPPETDVYITVGSEHTAQMIRHQFDPQKFHRLEIIMIENRGRDVSALLVGTKGFIMDYDYVCFVHDKKVMQLDELSKGYGFSYKCFENLLRTPQYVQNVIATMEENPRLGMLMPSPPNHAEYYPTINLEWGSNKKKTQELAEELDVHVPIHRDCEPISPLGTMFWFRPVALKKLFEHNWEYNDFPREPNKTDGSILHAIERVYGFVVQDAGYYPAWCFSDHGASIELTNLSYMLRGMLGAAGQGGVGGTYHEVIRELTDKGVALKYLQVACQRLYGIFPEQPGDRLEEVDMKLYYNTGDGFNEEESIEDTVTIQKGRFNTKFNIEDADKPFLNLRFDPSVDGMILIKDVNFFLRYQDGSEETVPLAQCNSNGLGYRKSILFLHEDPQVYLEGDITKLMESICVTGVIKTEVGQDEIDRVFDDRLPALHPRLFLDYGNDFHEEDTLATMNMGGASAILADFDLTHIDRDIVRLRFDPCEDALFVVSEGTIHVEYMDGSDIMIDMDKCRTNAYVLDDELLFLSKDPQVLWTVPAGKRVKHVTVAAQMSEALRDDNKMLPKKGVTNYIHKFLK